MNKLLLEDGSIEIDAVIVADGLGITLSQLQERMKTGKITSVSEHGIDEDKGRHRLTFFSDHRRFRVVIDETGSILHHSCIDYGDLPLPQFAHKPA